MAFVKEERSDRSQCGGDGPVVIWRELESSQMASRMKDLPILVYRKPGGSDEGVLNTTTGDDRDLDGEDTGDEDDDSKKSCRDT